MKNLLERLEGELSEGKLKRNFLKKAALKTLNVGKNTRGAVADGNLEVAFREFGGLISNLTGYLSKAARNPAIEMKGQMVVDQINRSIIDMRGDSKFAEVDAMAEGMKEARASQQFKKEWGKIQKGIQTGYGGYADAIEAGWRSMRMGDLRVSTLQQRAWQKFTEQHERTLDAYARFADMMRDEEKRLEKEGRK